MTKLRKFKFYPLKVENKKSPPRSEDSFFEGGDNMAQVRIRKRGKTFFYIFEAGRKDDGKRKVVEKGGFATRKLTYDAEVVAYNDWRHGKYRNHERKYFCQRFCGKLA